MERGANIFFYTGTVLLFLIGGVHLLAHFSGDPPDLNAEQKKTVELASTVQFEMPSGELRTLMDIQSAFSLYFVIFPIALALVLWLTVRKLQDPRSVLVVASFTALSAAVVTYVYAILPPLVMLVAAGTAFAGSAILAGRQTR